MQLHRGSGEPWHSALASAVSARLSRKRFLHSVGVMHSAIALARRFDAADAEAAGAAGLLHDILKEEPVESLAILRREGFSEAFLKPSREPLWHAWAGAIFARDELGVEDEDILGAIRFHPTAHPEMTPLQGIVFLADYIEPTRPSRPDLEEIRQLAREDLDHAIALALRRKIDYLASRPGADIHPWTLGALDAWETKRSGATAPSSMAIVPAPEFSPA